MIKAEASVVINRSVEDVESFLTDFDNQSQWVSGFVEIRGQTEGPLRPGYTYTDVRQLLGQRLETTVEITEYVPNQKRAFKTTGGPIPAEATLTLDSVEGGTRVEYLIEAETSGVFKLTDPVLGRIIQRQVETDFINLKDLLES